MRDHHSLDEAPTMSAQLHDAIVECVHRHPSAGAHEIAVYVAESTPVAQLRGFAAELLGGPCQAVLDGAAPPTSSARRAGTPRRIPLPGRPIAAPATRRPRPMRPAPTEPRSAWRDMLAGTVHIGAGTQKALGACTIDDLLFCIKERDTGVGQLEEQIRHLRHLITLMQRNHVDTVAEIPRERQWRSLA